MRGLRPVEALELELPRLGGQSAVGEPGRDAAKRLVTEEDLAADGSR
jgi:hypothetical protein